MFESPDEEVNKQSECSGAGNISLCRKDKRKVLKKEKRKQKRKELAEKVRQEEVAKLNDPDEQHRIEIEEAREKERVEKEKREFEEHERLFLEELAKTKAKEEEEERRLAQLEEQKSKQDEDPNRPTSNPLPPQSDAFSGYKNGSMVSAQQLLDDVAQQVPNFGTEHDKAHCPFHLKTGACRFGSRCSRVHFYADKSCTLIIKNMYNGPGLAWEQDEGLEHTDEEVERCYEEFYEDVHTEFLKFGEIINFKVCRNSSSHLRGNVYVQYKSLDSSVVANQSINGRYFAGKQVTCEFVNVTKWKVAICGEFMKSKLKACSRGSACNFIHCFHNPGGDYEWADWDKPPPRYWIRKMASLFGYTDEYAYERQVEEENLSYSSNAHSTDLDRYHSRRSKSKEAESPNRSSRSRYDDQNVHDVHQSHSRKHSSKDKIWRDFHYKTYDGEKTNCDMDHPRGDDKFRSSESYTYWSDRDGDKNDHDDHTRRRLRSPKGKRKSRDYKDDNTKGRHRGHSRKMSTEVDDHNVSKNSVKDPNSSKEHSRKERSKDVHYSDKKSSRHHNEKSVPIDDRWDGGSRIYESEHTGG